MAEARRAQAEGDYRNNEQNLGQFYVLNSSSNMVPLAALTTVRATNGPEFTMRYNLYEAAQVNASARPGFSSAQAMKALEIEQARVDKQQNDHQACAAKNAALVTQIESADSKINTQAAQIGDLHAKLSALESKVTAIPDSQPDLGFTAKDFEKVDKRLKLVEKKLQPPKPTV